MRYENALVIGAPASVVWDLTTDIARWPELTPTMRSVEPLDPLPLKTGVRARIKQPLQPASVWTVTEFEPGRRFAWETRRGELTMTGTHLVEEVDGGCRNTLGLELSGKGEGRFAFLFGAAVRWGIAKENQGFKQEAERLAAE
ncbi:SRPBCC family protein [Glycomyces tenuis]|uniref:SRPBCC family protein n=1 Tax=Glycomyces tenuis TaxID=58116 RepID=UPI00041378F8|nr:SRPBCC family protein [Glycomyces tenuis]